MINLIPADIRPEITLTFSCIAIILFSILLHKKMKTIESNVDIPKFMYGISIIMFLLPFFYVAFVAFFVPGFNLSFPPNLTSISVIFGGISIIYCVFKLSKSGYLLLQRDSIRNNKFRNQAEAKSLCDVLTGLYNIKGFITHIEHHLRSARRDKKKCFFLYAKIKEAENKRDKLNHDERDLILNEIARFLKKHFRNPDIIARVGEDKFMVFLIGGNENVIESVTDNFNIKLESYNAQRSEKHKLPISFCVFNYCPQYNSMLDSIIAQAECNMSSESKQLNECFADS